MGRRLLASVLAVVMMLGMLTVPAGAAQAATLPEGYVTDNLVFWLDANNNTGSGYDANATQWVNLVNTDEKVDVSGFDWGTDTYSNHYLDMNGGYIKLPETVRQALAGKNFTIEFLMDDYTNEPAPKIRNIMAAIGDDTWLEAQKGNPTGTVNDNFVLFMNEGGTGGNDRWFCFRTCYGPNWTYIFPSNTQYCTGPYAGTEGMTNTITFDHDGRSYWYQGGAQVGTTTNNGNTVGVDGFKVNGTWQTARKPQIIFGTNTDTLSNREEFVAKVKAIRIYTDSLTADEAKQNAAADAERYYTNPYMQQNYVQEDLVLWLDASNNTGSGFDANATQWVNLANPSQTVDVSKFGWGTDDLHDANYLDLKNGWIILPDEVRQAMGSEKFTVEFLLDGYDGAPASQIRNIMNATGDNKWLESLSGAVGTPNDNFVIFMNQSGGNNNGKFCFRTCYTNSSLGWTNITNSTDYCKVMGTDINAVTNSISFKSGGSTIWYLNGDVGATTTNSANLINLDGFRTTPGTASTWQTERKPQITFGTDNSVIASRAPFAAKVKAIRVYKDELTPAEVAQNAAADQERYYTDPYNKVPKGYVQDGLVLFLDALDNTGEGHSDTATQWVNLANTIGAPATFFAGTGTSYTWNKSGLNANGGIILPAEALAAAAGSNFTIEFLLNDYDATVQSSVTRNLLVLIGPDGTSGVWDDDFVCFQNSTAANPANAHQWCFDIKNASHTKYGRISVTAADVNGTTNAITFDHDVQVQWLQDGVAKSTGNTGASASWVTDINLTNGTRLVFGAVPGYMSGKAFAANVKSIRVYNRTLSASELSRNAEMDAARYMSADKLAELAKDSWNQVLVGNPAATTAAKLETFAAGKMSDLAAENLTVKVTDNKDGTFTFTYDAKEATGDFDPISYTLYVDSDYEVDFSTMTAEEQAEFLKDTYAHESGTKMALSFVDGRLVYDVTNTSRPVSGLYLPVYYSGSEFVWEMEIAYVRDSGSTWAGQLFAVKDVNTPQYTCTFNASSEGGTAAYEFCKRIQPDQWGGHVTTTLSGANFGEGKLDASKFNATYSAKNDTTYTLKYVVKDGVGFGFIDDVLVVEASNLDSDLSGTFGINSAGITLKVKSIKISTDTSKEQVFSAVGHYDVDIYEPDTAIAVAPSVMQMADADTYDVSGETVRPASLIFDVKAEDGVLNAYDGSTKLGALSDLYLANSGKAIVGVRIADKAAADLLIAYSNETKNENLWVFCEDGELLQYINNTRSLIRGVVEISAADLADIVDDDMARTAVYDKVYGYGHRTVVIPAEAATEDVVRELQSMKLAVIIEGYELTKAEIYDMVAAGPAAILTDDYEAVIDMLERFEDYTLVRPSLVVGHRGDRTYPDNSLESIISAAKSGAGAAEFDVIATLDGYLVLSHDNDNYEAVEYRNGTWAGTTITNAYWKKENAEAVGSSNYFEGRYFHTSTSQTPVQYTTLDQLFAATGEQYPALTYHIEVKDSQNDTRPGKTGKLVVNLIDELLRSEEYSYLRGRCDFLCFDTSINYPSTQSGYAVHNQNSVTVTDNLANSIYTYEKFYRPINSLLEPGTNVVTIPTLEVFKHYGMICCPWTYNNGGLYQAYTMGYHGFTTDYPHVSDGIYWSLEMTVDPETGAVTANTYALADHLKTTPIDVSDQIEIVSVSGTPAVLDGKVFGIDGDAVAARLKVDVSASSGSQKWFYLYSPSTVPAAAKVDSIEVTADPDTTVYEAGTTELDLTGGKITVTYNTGATEVLDITADMIAFDAEKIGDQIIYVTYEGCKDYFVITVKPEEVIPAVVGIEVTAAPDKAEYDFGTTELDLTGGKIVATYNTGATEEVAITAEMISGFDPAKAGDQVITVTYEGCKSFFVITLKPEVVDPSVVGIEVTTAPDKAEYENGEALDLTGGKVTVTYDDGSTTEVDINASMISGYVPTKAGDQVVTVSYQGFKSFFVVTVAAPVPDPAIVGISVIAPEITEYEQGDALDLTGGKVIVAYDDDSTVEVDLTVDMISGYNAEKTGEQVVTVAYAGCETFFVVTVNEPPAPPAPKPNPPIMYYAVNVKAAANGTVSANVAESTGGKIITLTAKAAAGYKLADLTITDNRGNAIPWATKDDAIVFVMPAGAVTVEPVFTLGGAPVVDSSAFIDVEEADWFAAAVDYVAANGLMTGTSTITFAPDVATSRAMIVTILYSLEGKPAVSGQGAFDDVDADDWFADPVNWAAANGIVSGYGNGKFGPNDAITREQLAAILRTYAAYKGWDVTGQADLSAYTDAAKISPWAETALAWAVDKGLISGKGDGILDPTGTAIRAEVAQVLKNFVEQF